MASICLYGIFKILTNFILKFCIIFVLKSDFELDLFPSKQNLSLSLTFKSYSMGFIPWFKTTQTVLKTIKT